MEFDSGVVLMLMLQFDGWLRVLVLTFFFLSVFFYSRSGFSKVGHTLLEIKAHADENGIFVPVPQVTVGVQGKSKSLAVLAHQFIAMFVTDACAQKHVTLDEAAACLAKKDATAAEIKTKARRLYDIANVSPPLLCILCGERGSKGCTDFLFSVFCFLFSVCCFLSLLFVRPFLYIHCSSSDLLYVGVGGKISFARNVVP